MSAAPSSRRRTVLGAITIVAVIGIGLTSALPAAGLAIRSDDPAALSEGVLAAAGSDAQQLAVAADAPRITTQDSFSGQSLEDVQATERAAETAAREAQAAVYRAAYAATPRQPGDDYPYRGGVGMSPLRYGEGQCTDFVAWRLNRDVGAQPGGPYPMDWSYLTPGGGDAFQWLGQWERHGWPVSSTPVVGSVAYWNHGDHVGYVAAVNADGSIVVEDYNGSGNEQYGSHVLTSYGYLLFLYPPPH